MTFAWEGENKKELILALTLKTLWFGLRSVVIKFIYCLILNLIGYFKQPTWYQYILSIVLTGVVTVILMPLTFFTASVRLNT